jgi:hypothetical protein
MAVGDSFCFKMGSATTNRQPSAGVGEQITSIVKAQTSDPISMYNGTNYAEILIDAILTDEDIVNSAQAGNRMGNIAININNTNYLQKRDVTDFIYISGVQVDA